MEQIGVTDVLESTLSDWLGTAFEFLEQVHSAVGILSVITQKIKESNENDGIIQRCAHRVVQLQKKLEKYQDVLQDDVENKDVVKWLIESVDELNEFITAYLKRGKGCWGWLKHFFLSTKLRKDFDEKYDEVKEALEFMTQLLVMDIHRSVKNLLLKRKKTSPGLAHDCFSHRWEDKVLEDLTLEYRAYFLNEGAIQSWIYVSQSNKIKEYIEKKDIIIPLGMLCRRLLHKQHPDFKKVRAGKELAKQAPKNGGNAKEFLVNYRPIDINALKKFIDHVFPEVEKITIMQWESFYSSFLNNLDGLNLFKSAAVVALKAQSETKIINIGKQVIKNKTNFYPHSHPNPDPNPIKQLIEKMDKIEQGQLRIEENIAVQSSSLQTIEKQMAKRDILPSIQNHIDEKSVMVSQQIEQVNNNLNEKFHSLNENSNSKVKELIEENNEALLASLMEKIWRIPSRDDMSETKIRGLLEENNETIIGTITEFIAKVLSEKLTSILDVTQDVSPMGKMRGGEQVMQQPFNFDTSFARFSASFHEMARNEFERYFNLVQTIEEKMTGLDVPTYDFQSSFNSLRTDINSIISLTQEGLQKSDAVLEALSPLDLAVRSICDDTTEIIRLVNNLRLTPSTTTPGHQIDLSSIENDHSSLNKAFKSIETNVRIILDQTRDSKKRDSGSKPKVSPDDDPLKINNNVLQDFSEQVKFSEQKTLIQEVQKCVESIRQHVITLKNCNCSMNISDLNNGKGEVPPGPKKRDGVQFDYHPHHRTGRGKSLDRPQTGHPLSRNTKELSVDDDKSRLQVLEHERTQFATCLMANQVSSGQFDNKMQKGQHLYLQKAIERREGDIYRHQARGPVNGVQVNVAESHNH